MASFNKVILMGNLTRDPEVRYTAGGTALSEITLAINRRWFDKATNQSKEDTTFIDVTLWGRTAEVAGEYLSKGRPVLIEGRLHLDTWDDKETGQKRSRLRVTGEQMTMLGTRGDGGGASGGGASGGGGGGGGNAGTGSGGGGQRQQADFGNQEPGGFESSSFEPSGGSSAPSDDVPF